MFLWWFVSFCCRAKLWTSTNESGFDGELITFGIRTIAMRISLHQNRTSKSSDNETNNIDVCIVAGVN
jgi:hypothetical protein